MAGAALQLLDSDLTVENQSTNNKVVLIIPADDFKAEFIQAYAWKDSRQQKRVRVCGTGALKKDDGTVDEMDMFYEKKLPKKTCLHKVTVNMKTTTQGKQIIIAGPVGEHRLHKNKR